ncbi:MAG TPA: ATP-binding protein [Pantanalinema sp.]
MDPKLKRIITVLLLSGVGALLNAFPLTLFPGLSFLLGLVPVLVAAVIGGPVVGAFVGVFSTLPTLFYWHDPLAPLRMGAMGAFVGALAPGRMPLVTAPLFWLLFGIPSELLYEPAWPLAFTPLTLLTLLTLLTFGCKQLLNALICAAAADGLLLWPWMRDRLRLAYPHPRLPTVDVRSLLMVMMVLVASIPTVPLTFVGTRQFTRGWNERVETIAYQTLRRVSVHVLDGPRAGALAPSLGREMDRLRPPELESLLIVDRRGKVLASSGKPAPPALQARLPLLGAFGTVWVSQKPPSAPTMAQQLAGLQVVHIAIPQAGLQAVAVIDQVRLVTDVALRLFLALMLMVAALFAAMGFASLMIPLLERPLDRLSGALRAVAGGDLSVRAGPEELKEVDELARCFNVTTEHLRTTVTDLQDANRRLQVAMDKLTELDKVKGTFLNAVSHDLRIPLTSIVGYAEFLQEGMGGSLGDEQRQFVDQILKSSDYMARLLNELLDFARFESGRFKIERVEFDYGPFLRETCAKFAYEADRRGVALELEPLSEPLTLVADPDRLTQVLNNLLSNAIKFTPAGGRIAVRACRVVGGRVRTEVSDMGVGIPAEAIPHLFEQFFQTEAGKKAGGTGLGLPIVRTIVEAHGGEVGVDSEPGKGSTFWFSLPATPAAE